MFVNLAAHPATTVNSSSLSFLTLRGSVRIGAAAANAFVKTHHHAGTPVFDRFRFGLYRSGKLVGVAIFSHPVNEKVFEIFRGTSRDSGELGRFVLLDRELANAETWFLARFFDELRRVGQLGVISFSDPVARHDLQGRTVFKGHLGTIYMAHNARYLGRSTRRTLHLWPDGRVVEFAAPAEDPLGGDRFRAGDRGDDFLRADAPWDDRRA
jgi:hypothetical protein